MLRTEHWTVQDTQTDGQGHGLKFQTVSVCIRCVRTSCQLVLCVCCGRSSCADRQVEAATEKDRPEVGREEWTVGQTVALFRCRHRCRIGCDARIRRPPVDWWPVWCAV